MTVYRQERWPSGLGVNAGALGPMFESQWVNCEILPTTSLNF